MIFVKTGYSRLSSLDISLSCLYLSWHENFYVKYGKYQYVRSSVIHYTMLINLRLDYHMELIIIIKQMISSFFFIKGSIWFHFLFVFFFLDLSSVNSPLRNENKIYIYSCQNRLFLSDFLLKNSNSVLTKINFFFSFQIQFEHLK